MLLPENGHAPTSSVQMRNRLPPRHRFSYEFSRFLWRDIGLTLVSGNEIGLFSVPVEVKPEHVQDFQDLRDEDLYRWLEEVKGRSWRPGRESTMVGSGTELWRVSGTTPSTVSFRSTG